MDEMKTMVKFTYEAQVAEARKLEPILKEMLQEELKKPRNLEQDMITEELQKLYVQNLLMTELQDRRIKQLEEEILNEEEEA